MCGGVRVLTSVRTGLSIKRREEARERRCTCDDSLLKLLLVAGEEDGRALVDDKRVFRGARDGAEVVGASRRDVPPLQKGLQCVERGVVAEEVRRRSHILTRCSHDAVVW